MLKKYCEYFYKIYFVLKFNANILIAQLNWLVNDLSETFIINWIVWIQFFDFTVKYMFRNKHTVMNKLSHQLKIKKKNEKKKILMILLILN